jgi:hypothetical protein
MDRWLRRLTTFGLSRGMRGSRSWLVAGMAALGLRGIRRMSRPTPKVLLRTEIKAGDAFMITAQPMESGRRKRRSGQ